MAVAGWLLLSLLTVQTVTGQILPHRDLRDAQNALKSDSYDWKQLGELTSRDSEPVAVEACGVPTIAPSVDVRVVGGVEAVPHSWPWVVSLQLGGSHFCGASLINSQWLVSAAHCAFLKDMPMEAVLGLHRRSQPDSYTVRVPVTDIIINPKYNNDMSPWVSDWLTSDIVLLKLAHPVQFNDAVSPVCLPSLFQVLPAGKPCYSIGWGQLSTEDYKPPDELMQVKLPLIERDICSAWHNDTMNFVDDSMVCAGYEEGGRGACFGDSGGPLVCLEEGRWLMYGIASWVGMRGCAAARAPTVYARASAYVNWIARTIEENSLPAGAQETRMFSNLVSLA